MRVVGTVKRSQLRAQILPVSGHSVLSIKTIIEQYPIRTGKMAAEAFRTRLAPEADALKV